MIIETSCIHLYRVTEASAGLEHCYAGTEVKRVKGGGFEVKKNAKSTLVRKAATRIIDAAA
jgi:hypothetical protein